MVKNKRFVKRFVNHLFGVYNVPRIPVYVHYGYPACVDPGGNSCFGVYCYEQGSNGCIHIAGDIGTTTIMTVFAHEFVHYVQRMKGRDMEDTEAIERDAEYWTAFLMGKWLIIKWREGEKVKKRFGVAPIWEEAPGCGD